MTYPLATLSLAIYALFLLIIVWRVIKAPIRTWIPLVIFLAVILLLHSISELVGPDGILGLIYILEGVGR
jgi:hypothetical protein